MTTYTINQLAKLAGVTTRTLRYYDQKKLLSPSYTTQAGYRMYRQAEIDQLQHILFLRELDLSLAQIKEIIAQPKENYLRLFKDHRQALVAKQERLNAILTTLDQSISAYQGELQMTNQDKFQAFKTGLITENENNYGAELRTAYGDKTIDESNQQLLNLSAGEYQAYREIEKEILQLLQLQLTLKIPSTTAKKIFQLHQAWLTFSWKTYSPEAHRSLGLMYIADERFTAYYDEQVGTGAAIMLQQIIDHYTA